MGWLARRKMPGPMPAAGWRWRAIPYLTRLGANCWPPPQFPARMHGIALFCSYIVGNAPVAPFLGNRRRAHPSPLNSMAMIPTEKQSIHDYFAKLAERLNGLYMEYTDDSGAMNLKLPNGRNQNMKSYLRQYPEGNVVVFMSKICYLEEYPEIDFHDMLTRNASLHYSKLVIDRGYLEAQAAFKLEWINDDEACYILQEVAQTADDLENEITGLDVY
jgi:hypothetical protein